MNYKVELQNGMTFVCNNIQSPESNPHIYAVTIGESVSFIDVSDVRWIDPTFEPTSTLIYRNQALRVAQYVAVSSKSVLVRYQMPNGRVFHNRLFPNNTYKAVKLTF